MPIPQQTSQFDERIKEAHSLFQLPYDWRLAKAQLIAESNLRPSAKSAAGAMGIAQFMPGTWKEVITKLRLPPDASPFDASAAIKCHAYYLSRLIKYWAYERPEIDRYCLALASYNAGIGNVKKARELSEDKVAYSRIIAQLPQVTGPDNAKETTDYVQQILSEWQTMILKG